MRITPQFNNTQTNNQPKFKSINIIQVSKEAFKNPDDLFGVQDQFFKEISKKTKELPDFLINLLNAIGLGKKANKFIGLFEQPLYIPIANETKEKGLSSIYWFAQKAEIPIKGPLSSSHHSFWLYTKEHKDAAVDALSKSRQKQIQKMIEQEEEQSFLDNNPHSTEWNLARENQLLLEEVEKVNANQPIRTFKIENFSELPKVFEEIDY